MGKKRTEIIIETERIILIRRRSHNYTERCGWCRGSASTFQTDEREQESARRAEPFQEAFREQGEVCPGCGQKKS